MEATLALLGWQCVVDRWPIYKSSDWNLERGMQLVTFNPSGRVVCYGGRNKNKREPRPITDMPDGVFHQLAPLALELSNES
ncbi:hypothetical protein [Burkholderia anthina]|uniref:hypothetical protein n=1 Tax=Burkholderia anthina TaxID=179879 RepID=UPI0037BF22AF